MTIRNLRTERLATPRGIVVTQPELTWELESPQAGERQAACAEPVFHLQPGVQLPLSSLQSRWQSRWGELRLAWTTDAGGKTLDIVIPPGCRGELSLHQRQSVRLTSGKHRITSMVQS